MKKLITVAAAAIVFSIGCAQASELSAKKQMSESEMDKVAAGAYLIRENDLSRTPIQLQPGWQRYFRKVGGPSSTLLTRGGVMFRYVR